MGSCCSITTFGWKRVKHCRIPWFTTPLRVRKAVGSSGRAWCIDWMRRALAFRPLKNAWMTCCRFRPIFKTKWWPWCRVKAGAVSRPRCAASRSIVPRTLVKCVGGSRIWINSSNTMLCALATGNSKSICSLLRTGTAMWARGARRRFFHGCPRRRMFWYWSGTALCNGAPT